MFISVLLNGDYYIGDFKDGNKNGKDKELQQHSENAAEEVEL